MRDNDLLDDSFDAKKHDTPSLALSIIALALTVLLSVIVLFSNELHLTARVFPFLAIVGALSWSAAVYSITRILRSLLTNLPSAIMSGLVILLYTTLLLIILLD